MVERLIAAGHWRAGDPDILIVTDAGYDITRLAFVLADLPVELLGRIRSDRVLRRPKPPRLPGTTGRPPKHGPEFALDKPATWPEPAHTTITETTRYGTATATSWDRLHPRLTRRGCWIDHHGELPVIEGTLIRLQVEHLPGDRDPKPVWLWSSATGATAGDVDRWWQAFLRRFDLEHTFRLLKQTLGWTAPKIRTPHAADRWTWLVIAAHTQLRLARPLAEDLRRPWEKPAPPGRLTPARVRRGFRNLRPRTALPASAPKPTRPRPRTPTRLPQPTGPHPPRRRKDHQTRPHHHRRTARRLKIKLTCSDYFSSGTWSGSAPEQMPFYPSALLSRPASVVRENCRHRCFSTGRPDMSVPFQPFPKANHHFIGADDNGHKIIFPTRRRRVGPAVEPIAKPSAIRPLTCSYP